MHAVTTYMSYTLLQQLSSDDITHTEQECAEEQAGLGSNETSACTEVELGFVAARCCSVFCALGQPQREWQG